MEAPSGIQVKGVTNPGWVQASVGSGVEAERGLRQPQEHGPGLPTTTAAWVESQSPLASLRKHPSVQPAPLCWGPWELQLNSQMGFGV